MYSDLKILWSELSNQERCFSLYFIIQGIFANLFEIFVMGLFMPFTSIIIDQESFSKNAISKLPFLKDYSQIISDKSFLIYFGTSIAFLFVIKLIINTAHTYTFNTYTNKLNNRILIDVYSNFLNMPYLEYKKKEMADYLKLLHNDCHRFSGCIKIVFAMLGDIIFLLLALFAIAKLSPKTTITIIGAIGFSGFVILLPFSKKMKSLLLERSIREKELYQFELNSFSNYKYNKILGINSHLISKLNSSSLRLKQLQNIIDTFQNFPKHFIETIAFLAAISFFTIWIGVFKNNVSELIPLITLLGAILYKLLPVGSKFIQNISVFKSIRDSIDIVPALLNHENKKAPTIKCEESTQIDDIHSINIQNLNFNYHDKNVFQNLNFKAMPGEKIAIIGESGSGKTTLIDIICGLITDYDGSVHICGKNLSKAEASEYISKYIGYVPQDYFFNSTTIKESIAHFRELDESLATKCISQAKLNNVIDNRGGLNFHPGENAGLLSGGQRQRLAIARALYNSPKILILDEATSALDHFTEDEIIEEITAIKECTIIFITHRKRKLEKFDTVIDLSVK